MGRQQNQLYCLPNMGGHGPLTGSAVVFQCGHMAKVHGQPYSLSELRSSLFCDTKT